MVSAIELGTKIGDVLQPHDEGLSKLVDRLEKKPENLRYEGETRFTEFLVTDLDRLSLNLRPILVSAFPARSQKKGHQTYFGGQLVVSRTEDLWHRKVGRVPKKDILKLK